MTKNKLFTINGYRFALTARDVHEMDSEGWKAAQEVVEMILVEAVQRRLLWAAHEDLSDIETLEELSEGDTSSTGDWMREEAQALRKLLIDNHFGDLLDVL